MPLIQQFSKQNRDTLWSIDHSIFLDILFVDIIIERNFKEPHPIVLSSLQRRIRKLLKAGSLMSKAKIKLEK